MREPTTGELRAAAFGLAALAVAFAAGGEAAAAIVVLAIAGDALLTAPALDG